jgi:HPt (histidine-containing phosphotransfer) domain-containing protein
MNYFNSLTMEDKMYNLEQIDMMSGGNAEFVDKMVNLFLELTPELLNRIKTGLIDSNYEEIKSAAHKMKPSIDMMGINLLRNEIRNIERLALEQGDVMSLKNAITYLDETLNQGNDSIKKQVKL